jgi:hypothetical protein
LPNAILGTSYTDTISANGGVKPYNWSLAKGTGLPPGMKLNGNSGAISGRPGRAGVFTFTIQVKDKQGTKANGVFSLNVSKR